MLRILDKNKVPLKGLRVYKDYCIEGVLELDDRTLSFSAPYRNIRGYVFNEGYIETKEDRYVIKEIQKSTDGMAKVTAKLDLETLEGSVFRSFKSSEQPIRAAIQLAFAGSGWTIGECSITRKRTLSMTNVSALEVLKQALKTYRAEVKVHSKTRIVDIYESVGEDKGVYFSSQLNLKKLTVQSTSYDFYTEIEPYGKDGLTIADVNGGKNYLENHQYSAKKLRCIWKDERYTVPESLKEDAQAKLADMSKPYSSYKASVADLASSGQYSILAYGIGDTITLMDGVTDTREKQRIVGVKRYPEEPHRNTCTLANKTLTFEEMARKYEQAANTVDNITNDNGQVDGDAIDGIYSKQIYDLENGIIESAYIKELTVDVLNVTGKITAVEGQFGKLQANVAEFETAVIGRLTAAEADIDKLRTTDLTAANAKIDVLESNYANIKNLLSGNAGIGDLQNITLTSQNAVIDSALIRLAVIQTVSVADLLAGDISTNKFRILSDDGGILIHGNTQQWRDADGKVRMQAGRDANGEFNYYITDANGKVMWNALGLTGDAIKNPIIKDSMVAEDANIAGTKLDIASITECINGSSATINANRIWFDEKNQNLNQLYTSMSSDILNASNAATGAAGAVQVMDQKLASIQTGMDGIRVNLSEMQSTVDSISDGTTTFTILQEYNDDGTVTLKAVVYKAGKDVTKTMPERWYTWLAKSEKGKRYLKYGYEITVDPKDSGFGTTYVGRLTTYKEKYLAKRTGEILTTRSGKMLMTWVK